MMRVFAGVLTLAMFAALLVRGQNRPPEFSPVQVVSAVEPAYPVLAIYGGTVVLDVTVGPDGEIQNVDVVRDSAGFKDPALTAVKRWRFKPATVDGNPITSVIPVAFSFSQPAIWWRKGPTASKSQLRSNGLATK